MLLAFEMFKWIQFFCFVLRQIFKWVFFKKVLGLMAHSFWGFELNEGIFEYAILNM
jgi:hypothetical protein